MNLRIFDSASDLVAAAAATITERATAGDAFSIALSGGNSPKPLYERLGKPPLRDALANRRITWIVVDERYVPIDDPQSNAGMIEHTLFADGMPPSHQFLRFRTELEDPARTAVEFERVWRDLGLDAVDIVLLGVGEDGHTASLFPGTPVVGIDDRIASDVFVPRLNSWRVTITMPVIRAAKLRIVLAPGAGKREIIRQVGAGADYPITRATAGVETWWFVDRAAVG